MHQVGYKKFRSDSTNVFSLSRCIYTLASSYEHIDVLGISNKVKKKTMSKAADSVNIVEVENRIFTAFYKENPDSIISHTSDF